MKLKECSITGKWAFRWQLFKRWISRKTTKAELLRGLDRSQEGSDVSITVSSNPQFELIPNTQQIDVPHNTTGNVTFYVNATGSFLGKY